MKNSSILCATATLLASSLFSFDAAAQQVGGGWQTFTRFESTSISGGVGHLVAGIGDVDQDGWKDYLMGSSIGGIQVRSGRFDSILYTIPGVFATSVCAIEDQNLDSIPDFVVGAENDDSTSIPGSGVVYLFSGLDGSEVQRWEPPANDYNWGRSVACVDLDNNGFSEIIIGSDRDDTASHLAGGVHVYRGIAKLWSFYGENNQAHLGESVAALDDWSGDGVPDIAVCAPFTDANSMNSSGTVYILSGADGSIVRRFDGATAGETRGHLVANAGDMNGDGRDELFIGTSAGTHPGGTSTGIAELIDGLTGSSIWSVEGEYATRQLGRSFATMSDLNHDGKPEFAVGAGSNPTEPGEVRIYSGLDFELLHTLVGVHTADRYADTISRSGDKDQDGFDELLIGGDLAIGSTGFRGIVDRISFRPFLYLSRESISSAQGGILTYEMNFPQTESLRAYMVLASIGGTGPSNLFGLQVPLTQDAVFNRILNQNAPGFANNLYGSLNFFGDFIFTLTIPRGALRKLVGTTLWHAAVSYDPGVAMGFSSIAVPLEIRP